MTALQLARRRVAVQIVDEDDRTGVHSFALALHPFSLRLLDELELADELIERGFKVERLRFIGGATDRPALTLDFSRLPGKFPFLLVLPQHILEATLDKQLRKHHVRVLWNHRVEAIKERPAVIEAKVARLDKQPGGAPVARSGWRIDKLLETHSTYLVGADGCRSFIRRHLGTEFRRAGETQTFAVFEFDTRRPLDREMRVVLRDGRANVLWPLSRTSCRWSFQIEESEIYRSDGPSGSFVLGSEVHGYLNDRLARRAPWFPRAEGRVRWSPLVQFERRLVGSFGRRRIWLAGDAAHQTGPIGVQSLNAGLIEAWELAGLMAQRLRGRLSPFALGEYGQRRLQEWRVLLGMEDALDVSRVADEWVRAWAETILTSVPATGEDLQRLLGQAGLELGGISETVARPPLNEPANPRRTRSGSNSKLKRPPPPA